MHAANSNATRPRPRLLAMSAARRLSILLWLPIISAALSGCATTKTPPPAETPPRINLSQAQREGAGCDTGMDGLRGRLPPADRLSVTEMASLGVDAETRAACWRRGYFALVGVADANDAAWERFANGDPQPNE